MIEAEELVTGDAVKLFSLPDGKFFVSKVGLDDPDRLTIGRITAAHIYFDNEISITRA